MKLFEAHKTIEPEEIDCDYEEEIRMPINVKYTPSIVGVGFAM